MKDRSSSIIFLVMRRMRIPLLVLLSVYTISIVGMTLIPGIEVDGKVYYMDFFHAFYFISYTATTIGFGEIPYSFSGAQRLWVSISIYLTVIGWLYAIGTILTLIQNDTLKKVFTVRHFIGSVQRIKEPFYLICGYGDTGESLVHALDQHDIRTVVVEIDQTRIDNLILDNHPVYIPNLCDDASRPQVLLQAGLKSPYCAGVVAITNNNLANLHISITTKLLNPQVRAIGRVDSHEVAANMASFGTNYIYNPFEIFAEQLKTMLHSPSLHVLLEWFIGRRDRVTLRDLNPPRQGIWVLCGYGRFGKSVYEQLRKEQDIHLVIVDLAPEKMGYPRGQCIVGRGTEAVTLRQAHIEEAVGLVAGTNDDIDNLSIVMTARELNPNLFVVIRENRSENRIIFEAVHANVVMQASQIIADHIRVLLGIPLLNEFMTLARQRGEQWSQHLIAKINQLQIDNPYIWEVNINKKDTPAIFELFKQKKAVNLECLLADPRERSEKLCAIPLLLVRAQECLLMPDETESLRSGDRLLWCGTPMGASLMKSSLNDALVLHYVSTGETIPRSYLWRWLSS
ncbi:potassium channel family protein [Thioflexithrix psekupsensis]|uniref:Potassium transporter TrkA n=1 Tax=Thioflexithrix psekupsensis TaxID=1570016 RepID=A0A251X531_9GAMM|nr:potassium channel family protein [Thioflexithrix psekupsensis]OUD12208.1 potassium transporter TrkA [Thioflexithrix psekupsensis]